MFSRQEYNMTGKGGYGDNLSQVTLTGFLQNEEDSPPTKEKLQDHGAGGVVNKSFEMPADDLPTNGLTGKSQSVSVTVSEGRCDRGPLDSALSFCSHRLSRAFTRKNLYKRIPILGWLPGYSGEDAVSDLVAGVTVGLTVIPQGIAYANVAGIPPQYGLYSSFMACFVYTVFGSCKDSPLGPTAIMAILTRENLHNTGPQGAILLCFLTGCVQLVMGALQLGFLIDFISGPVSVGFTSAAAIIIATTMLKDLLGLQFTANKFVETLEGVITHLGHARLGDAVLGVTCMADLLGLQFTANKFVETLEGVITHLGHARLGDAVLGVTCMAVLLFLRKIKDLPVGPADVNKRTPSQRFLAQTLWLVSTARNILVVLVCGVLSYVFESHNLNPFILSAHVKGGLPTFQPPPFTITQQNVTYNFLDMTSQFSSAIIVLPLLSILEDISLAKVFSAGKSIDATQEMLALGLCNLVSSFVGSMPVSGALSRGAVNNASGVRTTFGGIYTGILVLLSLYFFTPYFHYIPKASLAAVIIAAVVFMVEFHVIKPIWRTNKMDLIPAAATFLSCLLIRLELGIVIGISINVIFLLYASARPSVHVERHKTEWGCDYLIITPDRSLVFPSVEYVRSTVRKIGVKQGSSSIPVVIDSRHVQGVDFTAARGVKSLIDDFVFRNQPLLFYNLKPSVVEVFQVMQPVKFLHCSTEQQLHSLLKEHCTKTPQPQSK